MCDYCATFGRIGNRLLYREECDYCATFGRIGNQLPYRKVCDHCATFNRIGKFSYSIGKCVTIVPLLAQLVMIHLPSLAPRSSFQPKMGDYYDIKLLPGQL